MAHLPLSATPLRPQHLQTAATFNSHPHWLLAYPQWPSHKFSEASETHGLTITSFALARGFGDDDLATTTSRQPASNFYASLLKSATPFMGLAPRNVTDCPTENHGHRYANLTPRILISLTDWDFMVMLQHCIYSGWRFVLFLLPISFHQLPLDGNI